MSKIIDWLMDVPAERVWIRWKHKGQDASLWHLEAHQSGWEGYTVFTWCRRGFGLPDERYRATTEVWVSIGDAPPEDGVNVCPTCAKYSHKKIERSRRGRRQST